MLILAAPVLWAAGAVDNQYIVLSKGGAPYCKEIILREILLGSGGAVKITSHDVSLINDVFFSSKSGRFALEEYLRRGIISQSEAALFLASDGTTLVERITFVQQVKLMRKETVSSLRTVSAQTPFFAEAANAPQVIKHWDMPWMKENPLLAQTAFSHEKYPFAWELGRAATLEPGVVSRELSLLAHSAAKDTIALGGRTSDAYFFVHVNNPANLGKMKNKYDFKELGRDPGKPGHVVLYKKLDDILKEHPPSSYLDHLAQIRRKTGLGELDAIRISDELALSGSRLIMFSRRAGIDGVPPFLRITDHGAVADLRITAAARRFGIDPAIARSLPRTSRSTMTDFYLAPKDLRLGDFTRAGADPVDIGNLVQKHASPASSSIKATLFHVLSRYRAELHSMGIKDPDSVIRKLDFFTWGAGRLEQVFQKSDLALARHPRLGNTGRYRLFVIRGHDLLNMAARERTAYDAAAGIGDDIKRADYMMRRIEATP